MAETWGSGLGAKGFEPDFSTWWRSCAFKTRAAPVCCPTCPPGHKISGAIFDSNLVFSDIRPPVLPGVDVLLQPIQATVVSVVPDEGQIILDEPCEFQPDRVISCDGTALQVIHHEAD